MSTLQEIDVEIENLTGEIGLSVDALKQVLKRDDQYIDELVSQGHPLDVAERASFIKDLRNVISLMISHKFTANTAARVLSQSLEEPFDFSSTEDEEEKEPGKEEDDTANTGCRSRLNFIRPNISSSSSSSLESGPTSRRSSSSRSNPSDSSSDEAVEAKRIKLDPDYAPSTASEGTTTSAVTSSSGSYAASETGEEEEEPTQSETEAESYVQSGTTEDEDL
jgi:hypothetical protein